MLKKINRVFQDYMREKRLKLGKYVWDRKRDKEEIKSGNFIENNDIKKILFMRYDGKIGDMVINTLMFREIKKKYPYIEIGVITKGGAKAVIENNPNVDKIYEYKKDRKSIKELSLKIASEKYDLLIDFSEMLRVNQMMLINLCKARFNMGLNKENWKMFDISYTKPVGYIHITEIYINILEKLGIKNIDINYELFFTEQQKSKVDELLKELNHKKIVVFNPFAASKHRNINLENIVKIGKIILEDKENILIFIGEEKRKKELENVMKELGNNTFFPELKDIMETSYLISKADLIITPDTSIVHIAAAFKRKLIAIYRLDGKAENEINRYLWGPNYKEAVQIYSKDFEVRNGEEPDINKFDMKEIENRIKNILKYRRKYE
ncbi:glycosyltransferase family 9 protein [Fusobacterium varium]|uniref:glycosyltransferase family 9 protein n=1 Tax=Fusobacterium varium TaxID=856 RepID=UPI00242FF73A|nr:glycosyltransferase family 9 protein [Fusobacterium varium]MCF0170125.1 glycosyltransferase family 9 protein [Fusobacterium varium]